MKELNYEKGKDILIKLDDKHNLTGIYGIGIEPKDVQTALIVSLAKVCQTRGVDWKGVLFSLGLQAYYREFNKQKMEEKKDNA